MAPDPLLDESGLRRIDDRRPFPVGPSSFAAMWNDRPAESVAVVDGDRTWTTAELRAECDRVARSLVDAGAAGERVAWVLHNDVRSVISLIATVQAGAVWVGLSARATDDERQHVLDAAEATSVFDDLPEGDPTISTPAAAADGAALAFTSGTTGRPKGAWHHPQQLLYPAAAAIATEGLDHESRIGTPLPLSTLNILLLGPITALACGGTAVMLRRADADGFATDVEQHGVTRALVVPTIVHDLVASEVEPDRLASLERLIMGGAGFDRTRAAEAQAALAIPLIASYGLSEAPTGVARMRVGEAGATPLPGVDLRVEPDGEITLAPATTGDWAHTWQGTLGYLGDPAATAELWRDGRLHTGDAGTIDDDGLLSVTGRVSDMINRGGSTIAPAEVEAVLLGLDGVHDAAVFGIDDDRLGQVPAAAIVGQVDPEVLRTLVRERLSGYKVPERWIVLDALPRNANGKVDRKALRARLR